MPAHNLNWSLLSFSCYHITISISHNKLKVLQFNSNGHWIYFYVLETFALKKNYSVQTFVWKADCCLLILRSCLSSVQDASKQTSRFLHSCHSRYGLPNSTLYSQSFMNTSSLEPYEVHLQTVAKNLQAINVSVGCNTAISFHAN